MDVWVITTVMGIGGMFYMVRIIKKELPKRDKRQKELWQTQENSKQIMKDHSAKEDLKIQAVVNEEKQKTYAENRKKMYAENRQKGKDYETFITDYFRQRGYQTKEHGLIHGRKDKGIDVIIKKDKEITLIQCKKLERK